MDPLTTLLAAAAATGPNTLQSQALTALRSAGPQESFFTRVGNPHPLQMQQLVQPTTPQLSPIITQPTMAPTALTQPLSMPMMPMASPLADPTPSALHIPTLQAIHRMQQQASQAPAMVPTMPQPPTTQPPATMPRDPAEYTGPASAAQQCTQYSTTQLADNGRETCTKHGIGPHTARQYYIPPFGGRTRHTTPSFIGATRSTTKGGTDAPSAISGSQQEPHAATASTPSRDPEATAGTADLAAMERAEHIGTDPGPLGPDPQAGTAVTKRLSSAAPPPQHTGPREGASQSSQPPMETRAPSASYMDLTQEAAAAPQQPPSRFRPSNYTVDLSNTNNPPPPQVMVKLAVMMRRDERPPPTSFTVTEAAQLTRTLSEMGSGSRIPDATFSELAGILLSSGRRDQAIDISSEVMSIADRWSTPDTLYPVGRAGAHHLRHGRGRDGVLLRIHLGSRHISNWPPWHLIRRLSETQRPRSQDRGDGAGAGHGHPKPMVQL